MHKIYRTILPGTVALTLLLGSWRGHIALFTDGKETLLEMYPVRLELLPIADQEALRNGINISNTAELTRILEDLLS